MALVFVHGVATRRDSDYERGITARDALFRRYVYPVMNWDSNARPFNAYWGDAAAKFRWDHRSLPQDSVEAFGTAGQEEDWLLAEAAAGTEIDTVAPVAAIARRSVEDAVDLIWATAAQDIEGDADAEVWL